MTELPAEDLTKLAGWMYADLLLGLMVIFLATISFVPDSVRMPDNRIVTKLKQVDKGYNFNLGVSLINDTFDPDNIRRQITNFKKNENISPDSEIIFAQILGGFDPKSESSDAGRTRALLFSFKLGKALPDLFTNTAINVGGNSALQPREVALRLTFTAKIKS